ncbi:MAG: packaged DNA stabilization protein [Pseudomonadota bacterium]
MTQAQVAAEHYEPDGVGDQRKVCVNLYAEQNAPDPARPQRLVTRPGSLKLDTGNITSPRGLFQMDGHASGNILIADGGTLRTYDGSSFGALTGTLPGTDRVTMAFAEVQAGLLTNGQLYVSDGTSVAAVTDADWATLLSDHNQTQFTSIATLGQRLLATYGSRFAYSQTLEFNNTTTLSFYTSEDTPDGIVAGHILGDRYYVFGTSTIEIWVQTGSADDPFRPQTSSVIQRGCLARDTIRLVDNSLIFVADDYTVRRIEAGSARILSKEWVARLIANESPGDLIASVMEYDNHTFYVLNGLNFCLWFDVATGLWTRHSSFDQASWQWGYVLQDGGQFYGLDRTNGRFAEISRSYESEYKADASTAGDPLLWEMSAHLPVQSGRKAIKSVRLDSNKGRGASDDPFEDAIVEMALSKDGGNIYGPWRKRSLGTQGQYSQRAIWRRNGRARDPMTVMRFRGTDPMIITGVSVNAD